MCSMWKRCFSIAALGAVVVRSAEITSIDWENQLCSKYDTNTTVIGVAKDQATGTKVICLDADGAAVPNKSKDCLAEASCVLTVDDFQLGECEGGLQLTDQADSPKQYVCWHQSNRNCGASDLTFDAAPVLGSSWAKQAQVALQTNVEWDTCIPAAVKITEIDWHDKAICGGNDDTRQLVKVTTSDSTKPTTVTCLVSGSANAATFDCAVATTDCVVPAGTGGFDFSDCTAGFKVVHDTATYEVCVDCTASEGVESVVGVAKPGDNWTTGEAVWANCVADPDDETTSTSTGPPSGTVTTGPPGGSVIARLSVWVMTLTTTAVVASIC